MAYTCKNQVFVLKNVLLITIFLHPICNHEFHICEINCTMFYILKVRVCVCVCVCVFWFFPLMVLEWVSCFLMFVMERNIAKWQNLWRIWRWHDRAAKGVVQNDNEKGNLAQHALTLKNFFFLDSFTTNQSSSTTNGKFIFSELNLIHVDENFIHVPNEPHCLFKFQSPHFAR